MSEPMGSCMLAITPTLTKIANSVGLSNQNIKGSAFLCGLLPAKVPWMPVAFTISITTKCNLRCTMCSRTIHGVEPMNMSRELFLQAAKFFDNKTVTMLGAGEPFIHPNIFEFIEICQNKNVKLNLVTNGMLLNESKIQRLLQYKINSLVFSIDGVNEGYNKIRVGGNFQTVLEHFKRVSELRKDMSLGINFVAMKSNADDFPKLVEIFGANADVIELSHPIIFSADETDEHLNKNAAQAERIFAESTKIAKKYGTKLILRKLKPYATRCVEPWVAPYIGIKGDVYPCCMIGGGNPQEKEEEFYEDAHITRHVTSFGHVSDFGEVWNNQKFQDFRKALQKINTSKDGDDYMKVIKLPVSYCKLCPYRWNCVC